MGDFKDGKTNVLEQRCLDLLNSLGFSAQKNNSVRITDIDICVKRPLGNDIYVDFQYSADFNKYGELRVDYISAYTKNSGYLGRSNYDIEQSIKKSFCAKTIASKDMSQFDSILKKYIDIKKSGKLLDANLSSIVYFIFNKPDDAVNEKDIPDIIVIAKRDKLLNYIKTNIEPLISANKFKLNDKRRVGDDHGSAFIAIPLAAFIASKQCFVFYTKDLQIALTESKP